MWSPSVGSHDFSAGRSMILRQTRRQEATRRPLKNELFLLKETQCHVMEGDYQECCDRVLRVELREISPELRKTKEATINNRNGQVDQPRSLRAKGNDILSLCWSLVTQRSRLFEGSQPVVSKASQRDTHWRFRVHISLLVLKESSGVLGNCSGCLKGNHKKWTDGPQFGPLLHFLRTSQPEIPQTASSGHGLEKVRARAAHVADGFAHLDRLRLGGFASRMPWPTGQPSVLKGFATCNSQLIGFYLLL